MKRSGRISRPSRAGRLEGRSGEALGPDEPLGLEAWLQHVVAALAAPHDQLVDPLPGEVAALGEGGHDPATRLVPVEAVVCGARIRDRRVVGQDRRRGQAVAQARGVVVLVVGWGDLDGPRAEGAVDHVVRDHRDVTLHERDPYAPPDEVAVALVVRMDGHGGVAEDGLGPGRRDGDRAVRVGVELAGRRIDEVVADEPERAGFGRGHDLEVADAGLAARAPVDERLGPVGQAVTVQPVEGDAHRLGRALVHRVAQPTPVERPADASLLAEDHVPRGFRERAHSLEIALTAKRLTALAFLGEDPVEDELRGDAGMIESRQEERGMAAHPRVPDHQVLDGRALGVAQVQGAGHVRWRLDDRERRQVRVGGRARAVGREDVRGEPSFVDGAFDVAWRIGLGEVRHGSCLETQNTRSSSGRTGRGTTCWFGARGPSRSSRRTWVRHPLDALSGVMRHGSRATFTSAGTARLAPSRARFGPSRRYSSAVIAVKAGSVARAVRPPRPRSPLAGRPRAWPGCARRARPRSWA